MRVDEVPPEKEWINVETGDRKHPFSMFKTTNLPYVEVTASESNEKNHSRRWVYIHDGEYQVWVHASTQDEYGYELQPEERVSEREFEAINLKCRAIKTDRVGGAEPDVRFNEALDVLTDELQSDEPDSTVCAHLLIATYYAAKTDPSVDDEVVVEFRDLVHEYTSHVDTSHPETLQRTLGQALE